MPKILFIHQGQDEPSTRYRIYPWLTYLEKENIRWEEYPKRPKLYPQLPPPLSKRKNYLYILSAFHQIRKAKKFDVVFLQKFIFPPRFDWFDKFVYKLSNLVLDIPDAIFCTPSSNKPIYESKLRALCKTAKSIMVSNKFMYDWVGIPEKTIIMPTVLNTSNVPTRYYSREKKNIVVGWNGQNYQLPLMEPLFDVLGKISSMPNVEVRFITSTIKDKTKFKGMGINIVPFDSVKKFTMLQDIDIGLMPMDNSDFSLGKFSLKIIQYMACGVAVVCSPIGSNKEIIEDGENGCYASTPDEWYDKICDLINSPEKRIVYGKAARKKVEQKYSAEANWMKFREGLLMAKFK